MTRADIVAGALLVAFFGAALWEGTTFQYGTEFAPGPGFAPVWLSSIGVGLSALILFFGLRSRQHAERSAEREASSSLDKAGLLRVVASLAGLVVMVAIVPWLGLVTAILAFLLYLTLGVQRLSWPIGIGASVLTVLFVYIVFVRLLGVPIESGPLGF